MTLSEIRSRVRAATTDSGGTFITDAEIDDWVNEALVDITARLRLNHAELSTTMGAAGTSVANGTIDLPTDFLTLISLRFGSDDAAYVDADTFWAELDAGSSPSNPIFRVWNDKIEVYPFPDSGDAFKLRYVARPAELTVAGTEPDLPQELHVKLVQYAKSQALLKDGKEGISDRHRSDYEANLPAPAYRTRNAPGPFAIGFAAGPFDTASDATHV